MATGQATKLTGAVGEFLVAAELCRRGLLATPFAGNVPHYDIIASGQSGGHVAVQVKTINGQHWQFDIQKFLDVDLAEDGKRQILGAPQQEPFPELMCVLVVEWKELQNLLVRHYTEHLSKHNFVRPRAPDSFHTALPISDVEPFENEWPKILDRVPSALPGVVAELTD
jgi:hypothetical protein